MKTIWKGYIKFSLVTIPVRMFNATSSRKAVRFNLLHKECSTRIKHENMCPTCRRPVPEEEIIRGYGYGKDRYVPVTDEEIASARKEATEAIEVLKFVYTGEIPAIYYSDAYYLTPDGKVAQEAFSLFMRALEESGKTAVARVVMRNREHLFAVRPYGGVLIAHALRYGEEIQDVEELRESEAVEEIKVPRDMLELSLTILSGMAGSFTPGEFKDEYTKTLMDLIKAKAEGREFIAEKVEMRKVVSLMDALKRSVEEAGPPPKKEAVPAGRRRAPAKKKIA